MNEDAAQPPKEASAEHDPAKLVRQASEALDTAANRLAALAKSAEAQDATQELKNRKDRIALLGEEARDIRGRVADLVDDIS